MKKISIIIFLVFSSSSILADAIVHQFKSPSFNEIAEDIESALKDAEREADNTTLAKFLRNLESRVYSQLSRDIAESLFDSNKGGTGGSIVLEGSTITFVNDGINITLTVIDEDGTTTEIVIPVGIFGICSEDCGI